MHSDHTQVQFATYHGIGMKHLLPKLTARLQPLKENAQLLSVPKFVSPVPEEDNQIISQSWLWPRVDQFFKENDVVESRTI